MHVKPTHKAIKTYHATLDQFEGQDVHHELATRSAFQTLLADTTRSRKWMLVPELATRTRGRRIVPDGTLRDEFSIPRGFWEAKDTHDDLDAEIQAKIAKGYPTSNIIFDDTQHAVLYQDGREVLRVDLRSSAEIAELCLSQPLQGSFIEGGTFLVFRNRRNLLRTFIFVHHLTVYRLPARS